MKKTVTSTIGVVVIGRNEGDRLKNCLQSLQQQAEKIVYVDSGSTDGSQEYARSIGIAVVHLDMSIPFSAGRARNEGFFWLLERHPQLRYVQFIDGDCDLSEGWLEVAENYLDHNHSAAIVSGRRKEKFPEESIYNLMCDIEWDTPIGETQACGGDFMVRTQAFQEVSGFNPSVIAGEEPELCYRLRQHSWKIFRLDHQMTRHDAAIKRFSQWWRRSVRSGHAYIHRFDLHRLDGKGYCRRPVVSIWLWALLIPLFILASTLFLHPLFLVLTVIYPLQYGRMVLSLQKRISNKKTDSLIYCFFILLSKWAELAGHFIYLKKKFSKKQFSIIEYN